MTKENNLFLKEKENEILKKILELYCKQEGIKIAYKIKEIK